MSARATKSSATGKGQSQRQPTPTAQPSSTSEQASTTPSSPASCGSCWKDLKQILTVTTIILLVGFYVQIMSEQSLEPVDLASTAYDLKPAIAPRVAGFTLKALEFIVEFPIVGPLFLNYLKRKNGFAHMRSLAAATNLDPMTYPIEPASETDLSGHVALAQAHPITSFLQPRLETVKKTRTGFHYKTIEDYHHAFATGATTPLEIAQRILEYLARDKDMLNAVPQLNATDVLEQAAASTRRYKEKKPLGVFDGVPVPVKNCVNIKGYALVSGTKFLPTINPRALEDSVAVHRLREAGSVIIFGVNMHEIGIGASGFNMHHGETRNPHKFGHYSGGSSSGSAALVAAAVAPLSVGTDGGGSIRIPSSLCGVYGLKPTTERIPDTGKIISTVTVAGPIASSPRDLALAYAAMAGPSPKSPLSQYQPIPHLAGFDDIADLTDLTIGYFPPWFEDADPTVVAACYKRMELLKSRGAKIVHIAVDHLRAVSMGHAVAIMADSANGLDRLWEQFRFDLAPDSRILVNLGRSVTAREYLAALQVRRHAYNAIKRIFTEVDAIMAPTTAVTAPKYEEDVSPYGENDVATTTKLMRFVFLANYIGIPAVSVPAGFDNNNLPIGVQFMGNHYNEHILLRLANALGSTEEYHQPTAAYFSPL